MYCLLKRYTVCLISTSKRAYLPQTPCSCKRYCWCTMNFISVNQKLCAMDKLLQSKNTPGERESCLLPVFSIYNSDSLPCRCQNKYNKLLKINCLNILCFVYLKHEQPFTYVFSSVYWWVIVKNCSDWQSSRKWTLLSQVSSRISSVNSLTH